MTRRRHLFRSSRGHLRPEPTKLFANRNITFPTNGVFLVEFIFKFLQLFSPSPSSNLLFLSCVHILNLHDVVLLLLTLSCSRLPSCVFFFLFLLCLPSFLLVFSFLFDSHVSQFLAVSMLRIAHPRTAPSFLDYLHPAPRATPVVQRPLLRLLAAPPRFLPRFSDLTSRVTKA